MRCKHEDKRWDFHDVLKADENKAVLLFVQTCRRCREILEDDEDREYARITTGTKAIIIEATDDADALALKTRIELFLKTTDNGDFKGREIKVI